MHDSIGIVLLTIRTPAQADFCFCLTWSLYMYRKILEKNLGPAYSWMKN
jgi:hypothetical protein